MDIRQEAEKIGLKLRSYDFGSQYAICPFCSHKRKPSHRKLKCMSVKIDSDGLVFNCHHCAATGSFNAKRKTHSGNHPKKPVPRKGGGYGSIQRNSLSRWVRRT